MTRFIVVWQAYGDWKSTVKPFETRQECEKHIDWLVNKSPTGKDNIHCQIIPIEIDENA